MNQKIFKPKKCQFTTFLESNKIQLYRDSLNIIKVRNDDNSEMAEISINDKIVMIGNYWDFHNDCHGGSFNLIDKFDSYSQLANILIDKINMLDKSLKIKLVEEQYKFS